MNENAGILPSTKIERDQDAYSKVTIQKDGRSFVVFDEDGNQICGATNRSGKPCRKRPLHGKNRCELHGGETPSGVDSPNFVNGRYVRNLADKALARRYEDMLNDEKLVQLREEIALTTVMLENMLSEVDELTTTRAWGILKKVYYELQNAILDRDQDQISKKLHELGALIKNGVSESERIDSIFSAIKIRQGLVSAEHKRSSEKKNMMTAEEAMLMLSVVVDIIREEVKDKDVQQRISKRIREYVTTNKVR